MVGVLGARFSQAIAQKKRWIVYAGLAVLVLGILLGLPETLRGIREGYKD
jgi:hypothetical protein